MKTAIALLGILAATAAMPAYAGKDMDAKMEKKATEDFKRADTDSNGMLSKAEWNAEGERMFKEFDTNADGSISEAEQQASMKKHMKEWKGNDAAASDNDASSEM
jgi:Ca2+-binding EF-hand superfamily protein